MWKHGWQWLKHSLPRWRRKEDKEMSEAPRNNEEMEHMEHLELTDEEIAAMEAERQAAFDAKVAPYRALKEQIDTLTEIQETILAP